MLSADRIAINPVINTSSNAILLNTFSSTCFDKRMPSVAPVNITGTMMAEDVRRSIVMRLPKKYAGTVATYRLKK